MLSHWFTPLNNSLAKIASRYCQLMHEDDKDFPILTQTRLVIIGFHEEYSNSIREILYRFENHFPNLPLSDIGNFKSTDPEFAIPALKEILNGGLIPIILGAPIDIIKEIRSRIDLDAIIFHFGNEIPDYIDDDKIEAIGFQRHLCSLAKISKLENVSSSSMSLAKLRANPSLQEAVLRDSNIVNFDGNIIKLGDNPASIESNTSGLNCAEACQVMKQIGASSKLRLININNRQAKDEYRQQASNMTIAETIWYFLEGFHNKIDDHPSISNSNSLQHFIINSLNNDIEVTFIKNELTGRWWFLSAKHSDIYHACSYEEYLESSKGEIPTRLLRLL